MSAIFVVDLRRSSGDYPVEDACQTLGFGLTPTLAPVCRDPVSHGLSRFPQPWVPGRLNSAGA